MSRKSWVTFGVVLGACLVIIAGLLFFFVVPVINEQSTYSRAMADYEYRTRTLGEDNVFSTDLEGGGTMTLTEIGIRNGSSIDVWTEKSGWKVLKASELNPGFDIKYGFIRGNVKGRELKSYTVYSELGKSKMKPNGDFVIDVDNLRINDVNLFFGDGPFKASGDWKPGAKPTGSWAVNKEFKLGGVIDVAPDTELWPFNPEMGNKKPSVATTRGLLIHTRLDRLDPVDRQVEFTTTSGKKVISLGFTFFDEWEEAWWIFPYEGELSEIVSAEYQVRDAHYIYLLDVDFF